MAPLSKMTITYTTNSPVRLVVGGDYCCCNVMCEVKCDMKFVWGVTSTIYNLRNSYVVMFNVRVASHF